MNLLTRMFGFVAMVVASLICCVAFSNPPTNPEAGVVVWLPKSIFGYIVDEHVMSPQEVKWLPPDTTYWSMSYREEDLPEDLSSFRAIKATLIVAGTDSRSLHRPKVCLTAQGWAIEKTEVVTLETSGGSLDVMDYHLTRFRKKKDGSIMLDENGEKLRQRAHYVYWWVGPDHTTPDDKKRVWQSTLNSIVKGRNERWAYPSVMTYVEGWKGEKGIKEARSRAFRFIQKYAPEFQKSLGARDGKAGSRPLVTLTE